MEWRLTVFNLDGVFQLISIIHGSQHQKTQDHLLKVARQLGAQVIIQVLWRTKEIRRWDEERKKIPLCLLRKDWSSIPQDNSTPFRKRHVAFKITYGLAKVGHSDQKQGYGLQGVVAETLDAGVYERQAVTWQLANDCVQASPGMTHRFCPQGFHLQSLLFPLAYAVIQQTDSASSLSQCQYSKQKPNFPFS